MPLYDWICANGHRFEKVVLIANRDEPIPCEGDLEKATPPSDGWSRIRALFRP